MTIFGAIEAGGTKFVCLVGSGPQEILAETRFPTTTPEETLGRAIAFFHRFQQQEPLRAVGIGSFGPLDLNPASSTFGYITSTPKPGWAWTDIAGAVRRGLGVPVAIDTDVNAAGYGEYRWGAAQGCDPVFYITVGTGIGGGGVFNGRRMHGLIHPEIGHIRLPHDWQEDPFPGTCPYHGDCLEGLASGPALQQRWGKPAQDLPADHPAWELEARYLSLALTNIICTLSPQRIILGGGVMQNQGLFPRLWDLVGRLLNDYLQAPAIQQEIQRYIVPPGLGNRAGILGALALAQELAEAGES